LETSPSNTAPALSITDGSIINVSFATNLRDYAKYKVNLNTNQLLSLPGPSDSNISFKLLNSSSVIAASVSGLPLDFQPMVAGTYYLFIYNQNGWGSSYYGAVSITTVTNAPGFRPVLVRPKRAPSASAR
jgi:hypothetical protein